VLAQELVNETRFYQSRSQLSFAQTILQANPDLLDSQYKSPGWTDRTFFRSCSGKPLPSQAKASSFIQGRDELLQGANFNLGRATYGPLAKGWVIR